MDIKSKKFSFNILPFTKAICFILTIGCFTMGLSLLVNLEKTYGVERVFENHYYESREFAKDIIQFIELHKEYIGPDENGELTHDKGQMLKNKLDKLKRYEGLQYNYYNVVANEGLDKAAYMNYPAYILIDESGIETSPLIIANTLNSYYSFREIVDEIWPNEVVEIEPNEAAKIELIENENNAIRINENDTIIPNVSPYIYLGLTDKYLQDKLNAWEHEKSEISLYTYVIVGLALGCLISFILLIIQSGKKAFKDKTIHLGFSGALYNDINVFLCLCIIALWVQTTDYFFFFYDDAQISVLGIFAETLVLSSAALTLLLSLIKHIKNRTLFKHTLVFIVFHKIYTIIKEIYLQGSMGRKTAYIVIGYPLILLITLFLPVNILFAFYIPLEIVALVVIGISIPIGFALWLALKRVKEYDAIKKGVEEIKNGNYHHRIEVSSKGELKLLAENINSINQGLSLAVDNKLKSERLKTELITNVSHDIRTPLTSIITYVDLLRKEEDVEKREKYIEVIEEKSLRLKSLTDDLFEASKASTGNINANSEKIDIESLITQGLGELHEKIEERGYDFKVKYPEEKVFAKADGGLLWRVIENLISNILKYALKGSRVYIDVEERGDMVSICFKNISEHELNIPVDELIERFTRSDESRGSEGSGLGLSIAKSLTEIQNGKFDLVIRGDLFEATVGVPRFEEG